MPSNRLAPVDAKSPQGVYVHPHGWLSAWTSFWFSAVPPVGLHWLRIFSGTLFVLWLLSFAGHPMELFGLAGWFDAQAYRELSQNPNITSVTPGWSLVFLCGSSAAALQILYWEAIGIFLLFTLGIATRTTAVLTWALVISFAASPAITFDADFLLVVLAFYLMIGYVLLGQWNGVSGILNRLGFIAAIAIGALIGVLVGLAVGTGIGVVVGVAMALGIGIVVETVGRRTLMLSPWNNAILATPSYAANLAVRLIQVHFAIVVVTSCLHKFQFSDWWSGVALWYPLHNPFTMTPEKLRSEAQSANELLFFYSLAQYIMLAWQLTFPVFAWRPRWRWLLLTGGVVAWLGSIFVYGEPFFGPIYLIGCLSFLTPAEWQRFNRVISFAPRSTNKERGQVVKASVRA